MFRVRKRRLAVVALSTLVVLVGCTGVLVDRAAAPAVLADADRLAAGYEAAPVVAVPVSVPLAVGPVVREVRATGYLAAYSAPDRGAAIVVLSTPDAEVAGESANPLVHLTAPETVEIALDGLRETGTVADVTVSDVADLRPVGSDQRTVLGAPTTVTTYAATATTANGSTTDVVVHVAVVRHDGDVVAAVAVHDAATPEAPTAFGLFERIEHPADVPVVDPPTRPSSPLAAFVAIAGGRRVRNAAERTTAERPVRQ
jgi:hypothetical protein